MIDVEQGSQLALHQLTKNPSASLSVTYLVGALASLVLYFVLGSAGNLIREYGKLNWASVL